MFSRVAEARALAAQANRARVARSRGVPDLSCGGSTTSGGSPPMRPSRALIVVSVLRLMVLGLRVIFVRTIFEQIVVHISVRIISISITVRCLKRILGFIALYGS